MNRTLSGAIYNTAHGAPINTHRSNIRLFDIPPPIKPKNIFPLRRAVGVADVAQALGFGGEEFDLVAAEQAAHLGPAWVGAVQDVGGAAA